MHALDGRDFGALSFRFVVIADTHVNAEDGKTSSPFAANAKANARAHAVLADIDRWAPAFVVHVGDIVHPVPELPGFEPACGRFKTLTAQLGFPLYLACGNHDVGDKPVDWMPAGTVTQAHVEAYRRIFGPDFYSFDANDCHLVVINAQVINSGLPAEAEQREWLEHDLRLHKGKRTFLFTHYPPYVSDRFEAPSYDNIDEPGRTWLLDLVREYRPEALFAGHVHNQWYDIFEQTEIYILPSTAFVRQDYTELFRVAPLRDYGRDDTPKLGYYLVDVYQHGHVSHFIRSDGAEMPARVSGSLRAPQSPVHTKTSLAAAVGVDMRHAWIEWTDVAATGGVQEFERKRTRNDYPLIALWEMGCRKLRIPLQDLLDPPVRERMRLLRRIGHRFTAYVFGTPSAAAQATLREQRGIVEALEVITPWEHALQVACELASLRSDLGLRVYLSKLRRHEDAKFDGSKFNHFINHGFVPAEHEALAAFARSPQARAGVDGIVVRIPKDRMPWDELAACRELEAKLGMRVAIQLRLAADNPAEPIEDDLAIANRVAETLFAARLQDDPDIFFDSFVDADRNYFPHHGFVDRRYDPRLASHVYRHMHASFDFGTSRPCALASGGTPTLRWCSALDRERNWLLVQPLHVHAELTLDVAEFGSTWIGEVQGIDLATGIPRPLQLAGGIMRGGQRLDAPMLIRFR
jgi:3',5'-cyclic AMP phosphodiesterase CpdA